MASSSVTHFFILSIALLSASFCLSAPKVPNTNSWPLILAVWHDPETNLFYSPVGIGTPSQEFDLAVDLAGENLWYDCNTTYNSSTYTPISCNSKKCPEFSSCNGCNGPYKPGCTNNTCGVNTINPLAQFLFGGGLGEDVMVISQKQFRGLLSSCIDSNGFSSASPLEGLPKNSRGILGLSKSQLSLPNQLALRRNVPPKFSLCLPSPTMEGYTNLVVDSIRQDYTKIMQTTKLIVNPVSTSGASVKGVPSTEYFIDVKSVKIEGSAVNIKPSLLSIDKKGNGGTKISTMSPFTELESSVYKPFLRHFIKQASGMNLKRVNSVAPFEACYDSNSIRNNATGLVVPTIDLEMQDGAKWRIYGKNSMVMAKKHVACLGFVDGGTEPRMSFVKASIVIGTHQIVDNFLVFDLGSSKLSFSSSLLLHDSSCSD